MKFPKEFLLGASTAAHQVEGNNRYSDLWAQEQMEHSSFAEPSNDAVDHYHRYEEDIALLAGAGLNAYRFSIELARVEPQEGCVDESELGQENTAPSTYLINVSVSSVLSSVSGA